MSDEQGTPGPPAGRPPGGHRSVSGVFSWPIRVYYEDTDSGGVVYYANYLKYLERARTEWLRSLGFAQRELAAREGIVFVVRSVAIEYLRPSWIDDSLQVTVELVKVGASLMVVAQRVMRADEVRVSAEVRLACVDARTFKPLRIPEAILTKIGTTS